jgi:co-chaperonin GroES (HSP10)
MLEALGNRVIIKPDSIEEVTSGGIVIAQTQTYLREEKAATSTGTIIGFGEAAWLDPIMGGEPWVNVGDRVVYARYAGKFVTDPDDDMEYVVINDDAIQARIITNEVVEVKCA